MNTASLLDRVTTEDKSKAARQPRQLPFRLTLQVFI